MPNINRPVLVFTDRKELAVIFACALGGVMRGKLSIRYDNMRQNWDFLMSALEQSGYLDTYFASTEYVFVCMPEDSFTLAPAPDAVNRVLEEKESPGGTGAADDIDSDIPDDGTESGSGGDEKEEPEEPDAHGVYVPDAFVYVSTGKPDVRSPFLDDVLSRVDRIINASTWSISGELCFQRFCEVCEVDQDIPVMRVAPRVLTKDRIVKAYNAQGQERKDSENFAAACMLMEELDWLVSANIESVTQYRTGTPVSGGRLESVILSRIYDLSRNPPMEIRVTLADTTGKSGQLPCRLVLPAGDAGPSPGALKGAKAEPIAAEPLQDRHVLMDCFTAEIQAGWKYGMTLSESADALWRLFALGLITWPSTDRGLPWELKPTLTAALAQISRMPAFKGRIFPGSVDSYFGWDDDAGPESAGGILPTGEPASGLSQREAQMYELIGESAVHELMFGGDTGDSTVFRIAGYDFVPEIPVSCDAASKRKWKVSSALRLNEMPVRDFQVVQSLLRDFDGALTDDLFFFARIFRSLENRGLLTSSQEGGLHIEPEGMRTLAVVRGTQLVQPDRTILWDRRARKAARGRVSPERIEGDFLRYICDLADGITRSIDVLDATGGIMPDECLCPACGCRIIWNPDGGWTCESCSFFIPAALDGHTLTTEDMAQLVTRGETGMMFDFVDHSGRPCPGRLVLSQDLRTVHSFQSKIPCPRCGRMLNEYRRGLACPDRVNCRYSIYTEKCGIRLTEQDEVDLFSKGRTRLIKGFTSQKGNPFDAWLVLDDEFQIKYEFPNRSYPQPVLIQGQGQVQQEQQQTGPLQGSTTGQVQEQT